MCSDGTRGQNRLAEFLRRHREHLTPTDVGLPNGSVRRTPGLRREEVAGLAYISTEYYVRLEQARGPHPSGEVLAALARALRLTDAEHRHLHRLAGTAPARPASPPRDARPSTRLMIDRLPLSPAMIVSATLDVLAWNDLAAALADDFSLRPVAERNMARLAFLGPHRHGQVLFGVSDVEGFQQYAARRLRIAAATYPADPGLAALTQELRTRSAVFGRLWERLDLVESQSLRKTFDHRTAGPVTVNCDVLDIADLDQQVVIYTADPGSDSEKRLRQLTTSQQRADGTT